MIPTRIRRVIEAVLPWYDVAEENRRDERSEAIHQISIHTRIDAEKRVARLERVRLAYSRYSHELDGRR